MMEIRGFYSPYITEYFLFTNRGCFSKLECVSVSYFLERGQEALIPVLMSDSCVFEEFFITAQADDYYETY